MTPRLALSLPFEEVVLARHGETEWSRIGRRQGVLDSPMTPTGILQARRNADAIAHLPIDAICSSPLGRAQSSAAYYAERLELPVVVVEELHEIDHGTMGGLTTLEIRQRFPGQFEARTLDLYRWRFPGGESYEDADERARRALERIAARGALRPLVVSHEMIGRMLLHQLLGLSVEDALARSHPHDVLYRIDPRTQTLLDSISGGDEDPSG